MVIRRYWLTVLTTPKQASILLFQPTTGTPSADVTSFMPPNPPQICRAAKLRLSPLPLRVRVGFSQLAIKTQIAAVTHVGTSSGFRRHQSTQSHLTAVSTRTSQHDDRRGTNGAEPCSVRFLLQIWSEPSQRQEGAATVLNKCRVNTCIAPPI